MKSLALLLAVFLLSTTCYANNYYPVTVDNCGEKLTLSKMPERAIIHDINMAQMAFALDLHPNIAGLTGISGWYKVTPEFALQQGNIPELAPKYPNLENFLFAKADFFFAGWNYGMKIGGDVTPEILAPYGIPTLILSESCIHQGVKKTADLTLLYDDMLKLGVIFNKQQQAKQLIQQWQQELDSIKTQLAKNKTRPYRVFLFDSGQDKPFTAGKYAIIHGLIEAAHGKHIMDKFETSWGTTSWENVAMENPEWILLLDYQVKDGLSSMKHFLEQHPIMKETDAVKNQRYIAIRYEEITPGPANIGAIKKIAQHMYPDVFSY